MKSSTARNHFNRARDAMLSAYSTARACSLPHARLMEYTARARSHLPKTAPRWMHEALAEIDRTLLHVLHTRHVLYAFRPDPTKPPKMWEELTDEERRAECVPKGTGSHFWLESHQGRPVRQSDGTLAQFYQFTGKEF